MPSCQHERRTQISSTCVATFGYQSDTQSPLCPCCFHCRFEGISVFLPVPIAVITVPKDGGRGCPAYFSSCGFGSKRSMWLGPPSMKSQITDLTLGAKCGGFGASGSAAAADARSWARRKLNASDPRPLPVLHRKSRRDCWYRMRASVRVNELVRIYQCLTDINESGGGNT